jgi:predicted MFS family arabinose efflux permease
VASVRYPHRLQAGRSRRFETAVCRWLAGESMRPGAGLSLHVAAAGRDACAAKPQAAVARRTDCKVPRAQPNEPRAAVHEAMEGVGTTIRDARLRAILGLSATYGFFGSFLIALYGLRVLRDLGLSPLALGLLALDGGIGSFTGAAIVAPMVRRLGIGKALTLAYLLAVAFEFTIPLAGGPTWLAFSVLFAGQLLGDAFYVVENVSSLSLRQVITPPNQLGRVNAVFFHGQP